jgi:hypothetical protein
MNKKAEGTFWTIKNAILVLIVIVVVIAVFYMLIRGPVGALKGTGDDVTNPSDDIILKINNLLGGCNPDTDVGTRCSFSKLVQCDAEGKWIVVGDC